MNKPKYINAVVAYKRYGICRSLLRSLAENGKVRSQERETGWRNILKLYNEEDLVRFINGN